MYGDINCINNIHHIVYGFNEKPKLYSYTFYGSQVKKPELNSEEIEKYYDGIKKLKADFERINNNESLSGKKKYDQTSEITLQIREIEKKIHDGYYTIMVGANYNHVPVPIMNEKLPPYFYYEYIAKAKEYLDSDKIEVVKVYGGLFGGIIEYISVEGKTVYFGIGHGFMNKIYSESEMNELKNQYSAIQKISLSRKRLLDKKWNYYEAKFSLNN